jgi:rRNA maturation endonuclease Nob1
MKSASLENLLDAATQECALKQEQCKNMQTLVQQHESQSMQDKITLRNQDLELNSLKFQIDQQSHIMSRMTIEYQSLRDQLNVLNAGNTERSHWISDSLVHKCEDVTCGRNFGVFIRKHHCRTCGHIFCYSHAPVRGGARTCEQCYSIAMVIE